MIGDASREVWRLPSGLRFLEAISDSLTCGGVTIVLLEDWVDRISLLDDLSWHLSSRGLGLDGVSDGDPVPSSAFACLTDGLGLPSATSKFDAPGDAMRRLLTSGHLPYVTAVDVDEAGGLGAQPWISFAQEWASQPQPERPCGQSARALHHARSRRSAIARHTHGFSSHGEMDDRRARRAGDAAAVQTG